MTRTKYLKGECAHCRGHIEFPADSAGMTIDCPHCGKPTELLLAAPPEEPLLPRRTIVWTVVAVVIAGIGVAGMIVPLKMAQKKVAQKQAAARAAAVQKNQPKTPPASEDPARKAGFRVGPISLEKTPGSSLTYAIGTLTNTTNRQRFGIRIELDLLDASGQKIGTAKDYQQVIEPNGQWQFKALCVDSKAKSAQLAAVKEDQ
jgi:NhaP-type Na+/H+ or K+/H+ antiporter